MKHVLILGANGQLARNTTRVAVDPNCFATCGSVEAAVFESDTQVGSTLGVFFDQTPPFNYTFMGILTPGHAYELRYLWNTGHGCQGMASHVWRHAFTGAQGIATIPVVADQTAEPGPCF